MSIHILFYIQSTIWTALTLLNDLLHCLLNVAGNLGFGMHVTFDPFDRGHDQSNRPDPHFGLTFLAEVKTAVTPLPPRWSLRYHMLDK